MRIAAWINLILLTLLALATGMVKLFQMNEEMVLFRNMGFPDGLTIAFGLAQLGAGLLLILPKTRRVGAAILIPSFVVASTALFVSGVYPFAPLSLLFIAMAFPPLLNHPRPQGAA